MMPGALVVVSFAERHPIWPEIELQIVPDAGHSSREPGTSKLLVEVSEPCLFRCVLAN